GFSRDWSSDVCSSDLVARGIVQAFRRIPDTPAYAVESEGDGFRVHRLDAVSFMELVIANPPDSLFGNNKEGSALFLEWLRDAVRSEERRVGKEGRTGE